MEKLYTDLESNTGSKTNAPLSTRQGWVAFSLSSARGHNSTRFIAGTALIAGSFLVYLAYPIILLILPFSRSIKVGAAIAIWFVSWGIFSAGIFLAGREGFGRLKGFCSRIIGNPGWSKPDCRQIPDK